APPARLEGDGKSRAVAGVGLTGKDANLARRANAAHVDFFSSATENTVIAVKHSDQIAFDAEGVLFKVRARNGDQATQAFAGDALVHEEHDLVGRRRQNALAAGLEQRQPLDRGISERLKAGISVAACAAVGAAKG